MASLDISKDPTTSSTLELSYQVLINPMGFHKYSSLKFILKKNQTTLRHRDRKGSMAALLVFFEAKKS